MKTTRKTDETGTAFLARRGVKMPGKEALQKSRETMLELERKEMERRAETKTSTSPTRR